MQIRNNQSSNARPNIFWSKYTIKHHIFTYITLILILALVGVNLISSSIKSVQNLQDRTPDILDKVSFLLEYTDTDPNKSLTAIKNDILTSLEPVTSITLTEGVLQRDISKLNRLIQLWLDGLKPLQDYSLTPEGFENVYEGKSFTADLEVFFDQLDNLIEQTESLWSDFWTYRFFLSTFGDEQVKAIINSTREVINLLKIINQNQFNILDLLGHYTTKQIVVFNQNTGEARATGGFYGSYLPLTISQGLINIGQSQSIYWIDGSKNPGNYAHPAYSYYSFGKDATSITGARDLNFTPCFDVTAKVIEQEFSTSDNGYTIDHLIMITPNLINNLLPQDFVLQVEGVGAVTKDNFLNEVERFTSLSFRTSANPKAQISNFFKALIDSFQGIIEASGPSNVANIVADSIQSRDLMMWFKNNPTNELFKTIGLGSDQVCYDSTKEPFITPILMNFSGDKRNLVSNNTFALSSSDGFGQTNFRLKYQEYIPPNTFLQRGFNSLTGQMLIGIQLPPTAKDFVIEGDDVINRSLVKPFSTFYKSDDLSIDVKELPEVSIINQSARDIPGGFVYTQADGSLVLGSFITSKAGYNEVEFRFSLPISSYESITFYGQPGVNNPALSLGNGVRSVSHPAQKYFQDPLNIQKGIRVYAH